MMLISGGTAQRTDFLEACPFVSGGIRDVNSPAARCAAPGAPRGLLHHFRGHGPRKPASVHLNGFLQRQRAIAGQPQRFGAVGGLFRIFSGEYPKSCLKLLLKWLMSLKPTMKAASVTVEAFFSTR